jgi:hypothetical protein
MFTDINNLHFISLYCRQIIKVLTMQCILWRNNHLLHSSTLMFWSRNTALPNKTAQMVMLQTSVWKMHTLKLDQDTHCSEVYMDCFTQHIQVIARTQTMITSSSFILNLLTAITLSHSVLNDNGRWHGVIIWSMHQIWACLNNTTLLKCKKEYKYSSVHS